MITMKQILHNWLLENKYDGLCNQEIECGCKCSDFMPCDTPLPDCVPAYLSKKGDGEHAFLMTPKRPAGEKI